MVKVVWRDDHVTGYVSALVWQYGMWVRLSIKNKTNDSGLATKTNGDASDGTQQRNDDDRARLLRLSVVNVSRGWCGKTYTKTLDNNLFIIIVIVNYLCGTPNRGV